jgi:alkaline phosphatase
MPFFVFLKACLNMNKKDLFPILSLFISITLYAQPSVYTVSNGHSHNDYEQPVPFKMAYSAGFGSIEADIFLINGALFVAHDTIELKRKITMEDSYIKPLLLCMQNNNGYPFADTTKKLQMLIDIKTDSIGTLNKLIEVLKKYFLLINCKSLTWVITGNRPDESLFNSYPSFIRFDGELYKNYSTQALEKISMLSDDFKRYSLWNGKNNLPETDDALLRKAINKSHRLHKPVRFWDAPDNENAWKKFIELQVDYINTDHIKTLGDFLNKFSNPSPKTNNTAQ